MVHRRYTVLLACFILACLIFSSSPSQGEQQPLDYCAKCRKKGWIVNKSNPIPFPYYCTTSIDEKRGYDLGWEPCDKCQGTAWHTAAVREYSIRINDLKRWDEGRRMAVDKEIFKADWEKLGIMHITTEHWKLTTNFVGRRMDYRCLPFPVPKWLAANLKIEKFTQRKLETFKFSADPDLALRVYAYRLEFLYDFFMKTLEKDLQTAKANPEDDTALEEAEEATESNPDDLDQFAFEKVAHGDNRYPMFIWRTDAQDKACRTRMTGGANTRYTQWTVHSMHDSDNGNDEMLLHKVVHNGTEQILVSYIKWPPGKYDFVPYWFNEGLSHWMEYTLLGSVRVCSRHELPIDISVPPVGLRSRVYRAVKSGNYNRLTTFADWNLDKLTPDQRVIGFSLVDYLLTDTKRLRDWLKHYKDHLNQSAAFRDAYGDTMSDFENKWEKWVLETYKGRTD